MEQDYWLSLHECGLPVRALFGRVRHFLQQPIAMHAIPIWTIDRAGLLSTFLVHTLTVRRR